MRLIIVIILVAIIGFFSCKKERNVSLKIIKNCSGEYLRNDLDDYKIVNPESTEAFANEEEVIVTYKEFRYSKFPEEATSSCYMTHNFKAWAEIIRIRRK